jgi:hypothetical protein
MGILHGHSCEIKLDLRSKGEVYDLESNSEAIWDALSPFPF